jgi:hypothetical protein
MQCVYTMPVFQTQPTPIATKPPHTPYMGRVVYFSFFLDGPLTFAVPRRVFCLFLRCLPVCECQHTALTLTLSSAEYEYPGNRRTLLSGRLLDL